MSFGIDEWSGTKNVIQNKTRKELMYVLFVLFIITGIIVIICNLQDGDVKEL